MKTEIKQGTRVSYNNPQNDGTCIQEYATVLYVTPGSFAQPDDIAVIDFDNQGLCRRWRCPVKFLHVVTHPTHAEVA